jgi:hypothetical protein
LEFNKISEVIDAINIYIFLAGNPEPQISVFPVVFLSFHLLQFDDGGIESFDDGFGFGDERVYYLEQLFGIILVYSVECL